MDQFLYYKAELKPHGSFLHLASLGRWGRRLFQNCVSLSKQTFIVVERVHDNKTQNLWPNMGLYYSSWV